MGPSEVTPNPDFPFPEKAAAIDIGTNTILLLIAGVDGGALKPLVEIETIVGLGKGLHRSGVLSPEAMNRGYETLNQCLERCQRMGVQQIFAAGTSALREAKNAGEFLGRVKEKLGLSIEVISGEEEAHLTYLAVARGLHESKGAILVADVGGGSTEFILGKGDQINRWVSLPLGSVRFTEQFLMSDPVQEEEWNRMEKEIHRLFFDLPQSGVSPSMVAVGGTATTLASVELGLKEFNADKIHHFVLTKEALSNQLSLYRSRTIDERRKIPGLFRNRADVILAGGAILYFAMEESKCPSVLISCHGIRYGLLYRRLNLISNG
jgi:exopolyphosphatase/guanosine-5'-triphosphate,3'-diphosphate pyrophosphatase